MTKKILAFLMCTVMIFSSVPFSPLSELVDFAVSVSAVEEIFKVTFPEVTVYENSEKTIVPVATYMGNVVESGVTYTWSSVDTSVATVDQNGTVKGISAGKTSIYITASYLGMEKTYILPMQIHRFRKVDTLEADASTVDMLKNPILEKQEKTLYVSVLPITATVKELEWKSSDESVVKILSSGVDEDTSKAYAVIRAVGEGKATVTYTTTDGTGKSGSFIVTVEPLIKKLTLPPFVVITTSSTGYSVSYKISPENAGNKRLEWHSDNSAVCFVDAFGNISAGQSGAAGKCFVTARTLDGSNITARTYVVVSDGTKSISLDQKSLSMKVGDKNIDLTATCVLGNGEEYVDAVTWKSSNTGVAVVDSLGIVKAVGPGEAVITAITADGTNLSAQCTVSVTQPVKGISLPETEVCWKTKSIVLTPVFNPANASDKGVTWFSSDESVATVNQDGLVTGLKIGYATISVKTNDGGYMAYCRVSVEEPPEKVEISSTSLILTAGKAGLDTGTLTATVLPESATNKNVSWSSSNEKVATVDETGKVTALAGGTAVITCTTKSGGKKASCMVVVNEYAKRIDIVGAPDKMFASERKQLEIDFYSPTVTHRDIEWKSSDPYVVRVDDFGMLTAMRSGGATITATYRISDTEYLDASIYVLVDDKVSVTGVTINRSKQTFYMGIGANEDLYEIVTPSNASDKSVYWTTSNKSVADVVRTEGVVVGKKPGTAKITATTNDGGYTDYCTVVVLGEVEFMKSSAKIPVGSTERLDLDTANPYDTKYTWRSSDTSVATVDQNGVVKGIKAGSVTITVSTPNNLYSATCKVNVVVPVTGVKINSGSITVPKGETRSVTATVYPSGATDKKVTWTTPAQTLPVIVIDAATGLIRANRVGTTTVTVVTNDGKYTDSINVEVIQPVTEITFGYSSITLDAGKKKTLTPQIKPLSATNKNVKWTTSNKKIATVDSKGVITAVAAGTATITCTSADGYAKQTVKVTVTQPPTGIRFSSKSITVKIGTPRKLNTIVEPETAANKNVIYKSSDEKIAKVAADGTVTGVKKGTATITATTVNSLYSATIKVKVVKPVKSVKLNKTSITIAVGKNTTITSTVSPSSASNKDVKWKSSDNDVVTVKNGKITAKAPGYAVVTCTTVDGGKTAECTVFVNQPVKSVKLNKSSLILDIDQKYTLKSTLKPSDASNKALKWTSSKKSVVKVSSKGVLTPVGTGTATITVTTVDGGFKATCKVTVVKRVKSVSLPKTLTVYLGEEAKLKATLNPKKPSNSDITWKSGKKSVATVSSKGVVKAKKTGTANITVTTDDGGKTATCKVSVKRKLSSFTLNKKSVTLNTGATFNLKVTRKPSNATEGISYTTSNKKVATVSSSGVITAKGRGTATITAKSERGITVKCKVTVNQPVNSMYISRNSAYVYMGETLKLTANVLPENANNQKFTWSTSNSAVATVSGGTVVPKRVGTAVITVKSQNGKTASCTVTVRQHVTGIALSSKALSLEKGATASLKVTVSPSNATNKLYGFTTSDANVVTVSSAGLVTAKNPGTATVTVISAENNKKAVCQVMVIERVKGVDLSNTAETLYIDKYGIGETLQLKAEIFPSNATNKGVTWSSTDTDVATVDKNGLVTAVKSGVALIRVTTDDGKKTADCTVTVLQNVSGISFETSALTINRGQSLLINAVVEPSDAYNKNIFWSYEVDAIATVDEYGWLTGVAVGRTIVYATSVDGAFRASCLVTVNEPVTGISLDITEVPSLYRDEQIELTPTVYPDILPDSMKDYINRDVIWTSSDEGIARVENGVVTAVGAGEAVITAKTVDGGFTAECKVTCFMPVEEITTEADDYYIKIGEEYAQKIDAVVLPSDASFPEVSWSIISGEEYFTCENGVITGLSMGSGRVRITSVDNPDVTKEFAVHIVKRVEEVKLDKAEQTLNKGETSVLVPTVLPSDAHNKAVTFASDDESVVTVSEDGVVTAVGKGTAKVTVTTVDEGKTAECIFNVVQPVEEITFTESEYSVGAGKKITLDAVALPENANDKTLKWESSDSSVATVANGIVTGIRAGEIFITATATDTGIVTATVKVTVVKHAENIELTAETDTLWVGDSTVLSAVVLPEDTTDKTVTFTSSDETVATVDSDGKVTAVSAGEEGIKTVVITAVSACTSAVSQFTFTVKQQVTDIQIPEDTVVLEYGQTYTFAPVVLPENAFDKSLDYISSDESIITVEDGTATATGTGTATVTLVSLCGKDKIEKQCSIKVIVLPAGIDMEKDISVEKTKTYQLNAVLSPDNVTEAEIIWTSSDEEIATVDENGVVTALKAGTAIIRAQSEIEEIFAECTVTVYVNSEKIELTADKYELYIGEEFTLGATVLPEDTTNKNITYTSSDEEVITVDSEGKITAVGKGTATVTVTAADTGITSVCEVTVRKHAEGISMAEDAVAYVGRTLKLTADVLPLDADNRNVRWSVSDTRTASVDADGVLTAHEKGFVLVTAEAEDGGFKAICFVEIKTGIDSVSLDKDALLLDRGASESLSFSVLPVNADDKKVIWTSSDETVATVDKYGNVTATQKSGVSVIRATAIDNPDAYAECTVTVKVPLEAIYFSDDFVGMRKGESKNLTVVFRPENVTVKDVSFESSNSEIASVDENGVVTAHTSGEADITVTYLEGGQTAVCKVKVYKEIESFTSQNIVINKGRQASCSEAVYAEPYDHDEVLVYSWDNDDVVSVDENGVITAKAPGTANITVEGSISKKTQTFTVVVKEPVVGVRFENESATVEKSSYIFVKYDILPVDANNIESITFTSSDEDIAKIFYNSDGTTDGTVQALQEGTVEITVTVTTNDGVYSDTYTLFVTEAESE